MVKIFIFVGMPSLLEDYKRNSFDVNWPVSKELPPLTSELLANLLPQEQIDLNFLIKQCSVINSQKLENPQQSAAFKPRKVKMITNCPHKNRKHYAKNMCSDCYNKNIKLNKKTTCGHPDKEVFSRNMCLQCYTKVYRANKKKC